MSFVTDFFDALERFRPWTTINDYENGLYYTFGRPRVWKISDKKLDYVLQEEWEDLEEDKKLGISRLKDTPENIPKNLSELKKMEYDAYTDFLREVYLETYPVSDKKIVNSYSQMFLSHSIPDKYQKFDPKKIPKYSDWKVHGNFPSHPTRYRTNIPHGTYLHTPTILGLQKVPKLSTALIVKDLKFVSILADGTPISTKAKFQSIDKKGQPVGKPTQYESHNDNIDKIVNYDPTKLVSVMIGGMLRYKIENFHSVYSVIEDWESSYQSQAMILISDYCRERSLTEFYTRSFADGLKKNIRDRLNEMPREDWGIKTKDFGLFTVSTHKLNRNIQELSADSLYINLQNTPPQKSDD
jgi:hypothetical protein